MAEHRLVDLAFCSVSDDMEGAEEVEVENRVLHESEIEEEEERVLRNRLRAIAIAIAMLMIKSPENELVVVIVTEVDLCRLEFERAFDKHEAIKKYFLFSFFFLRHFFHVITRRIISTFIYPSEK